MIPLAVDFPSWLKPEIIPGLPIRWYGLMYIFAFGTAFLVYRRQVRERNFPMTEDQLSGMFFWVILSIVLGARIFSTLVYEVEDTYRRAPWLILWPFRNGRFTGLQGMSYHGGVIGGILSMIIYSKVKKFAFREIADMFAASIPLGYTFGRLGNFINGELYGRITSSPIGMYFPNGHIYPGDKNFEIIKTAAEEMGLSAAIGPGGALNFPRHPSQLYEMLLEGVILWAVIWFSRKRKPFRGFLTTLYISGYGFVRFFIEYFREPDSALGYPIQFVTPALPPAISHPLLCFSTGQILCFLMIIAGLIWAVAAWHMKEKEPLYVYPAAGEKKAVNKTETQAERNRRRKMRNKLR